MAQSTITSKYQTTVPKEVRQRFGVRPGDVLKWEVAGNEIRVTAADTAFLRRQGSVQVGAGDVVEDIRRARALRGTGRNEQADRR
jgi:AbrB family looped-hinge helix DNA binding protein